jgi:transglutaminase-like putative cysteine protease
MAGRRARKSRGDSETSGYRLEITGMIELVGRLIRWFVHSIGASTLVRLVLLTLTMVSVERGIVAIVGHIRPDWLGSTVFYGTLIGWLLGRSKARGWASALALGAAGLAWLTLSVGQMSIPVDGLILSMPPMVRLMLMRIPPEIGAFVKAWSRVMQGLGGLADRITLWIQNAGTSTLVIDPGVTSLVWGLALWLVATWAAWWIRRKGALGIGLLPATILLTYNVYYTNSRNGIIWLVLTGGGWICLQALDSYLKARRRWQERRMGQTDIEPMLAFVVICLAGGLMLAGGLIPSISIQKISDTFQHIIHAQQDKNLAESLGLQQTPEVSAHKANSAIGLTSTHSIGPGPNLSQDVMMYVTVEGYQPPPPPDVLLHATTHEPEVRYYWRSQIFDAYNGHVWIANSALTQSLPAGSPYHPNLVSLPKNYTLIRQHVERQQPMDEAVFVTGELLSTDQPSTAVWRASGDLIDARTNVDSFTADSRIQNVSVDSLRRAGKDYPQSVRNYLSLPDELPERVRDLAVRLSIDQPTPYDQVMAIQTYLRQFPYSLKVPGAPTNRDVADYFLFDLQKGYCDYFATSMAVMVRAVGIPTRLVTGFSSGTYDYKTGRFVVVEANAHSWVEVYFPGIGWVEFEPTTNQLPFSRPGETTGQKPIESIPIPAALPENANGRIDWDRLSGPLTLLESILAGTALLMIAWLFLPVESWLLNLQSTGKALTIIHRRLYRQGRTLGVPGDAARTPHEFASAFSTKLDQYARNRHLGALVRSLQADVDGLTALYTRLLFSPRPPSTPEQRQAIQIWAHVRKNLRKIRHS